MGVMKWNAYEKMKGKSVDLMYKLIIIDITAIFTENNLEQLLVNKNRPGPNYYDDCIKFNWVDALKDKHKMYMVKKGDKEFYSVKLTDEEKAFLKEMSAINLTAAASAVAAMSAYVFV